MNKRFNRKAAALFCIFLLLIGLLTGCAGGASGTSAEEDRLLRNGYYAVYDEDDDLLYYCQVKDNKMILVKADGKEKMEFRLSYDAEEDRYTIKRDGEGESFSVSESKNGLRIRSVDDEKLLFKKVSKNDVPDFAAAAEVDGFVGGGNTVTTYAPAILALRLVTGGESGTYYSFGTAIANHASANIGRTVTVRASGGSKVNISMVAGGEAELGFCQSDYVYDAYTGTGMFEQEGIISGFSVIGALYSECIQLVSVDPNVRSVYDLWGKKVSVGAVGYGMYREVQDILSVYGMSVADITPVYASMSDSLNDLKAGRIDAAFVVAGAPTAVVSNLCAAVSNAHLVSFDEEHINKLMNMYPGYGRSLILGGTYSGQLSSVVTPSVAATLVVRDDVSEETVYRLTKDIFDNAGSLTSDHVRYADISQEYGASLTSFPYHPGAARYFRERGYSVSTDAAGLYNSRKVKIGLVTDVGGINDKSFNQTSWEGLQALAREDSSFEVKYLESRTDADYRTNINRFIDEKYDLIICVGYMLSDATREAALAYPNQKFAIIDDAWNSNLPNVACLMFAQEEASYLVGLVAGSVTKSKTVGYVQGMVSDSMNLFGIGFISGVLAACPDAVVLQYNANNFGDITGGQTVAKDMITRGADVIYHAAGGTGIGVISACDEAKIWAIGVDTDQALLAPNHVITSAVKRVDVAAQDIARDVKYNSFYGGIHMYNIRNGGVDLAPTRTHIPASVLALVEAAKADIIAGRIVVPTNVKDCPQFVLR